MLPMYILWLVNTSACNTNILNFYFVSTYKFTYDNIVSKSIEQYTCLLVPYMFSQMTYAILCYVNSQCIHILQMTCTILCCQFIAYIHSPLSVVGSAIQGPLEEIL